MDLGYQQVFHNEGGKVKKLRFFIGKKRDQLEEGLTDPPNTSNWG